MKRFIAFFIALAFLTIGNPMRSFSQEQDTTKPVVPATDTTKPLSTAKDTTKPGTQNKVTPITSSQGQEITDHIQNKEHAKKKEKRNILYRIHRIGHKKRERAKWHNEGHYEFYTRPKREQKRISRHHLNPNKPTKTNKKMMKKLNKKLQKGSKKAKNKPQKASEENAVPNEEADKPPKDDNVKPKEEEKPKEEPKPKEEEKPKEDTTKHGIYPRY